MTLIGDNLCICFNATVNPGMPRIESKEYCGVSTQKYNNADRHGIQQKLFINSEQMSDVCFIINGERMYAHR